MPAIGKIVGLLGGPYEGGNRRGQKTPRIFRWSFFRCPMAKFVGDICLTIPETRFLLGLAIE